MFSTLAGAGVGAGGGGRWTNTASGGGAGEHALRKINAATAASARRRTDNPITPNMI